MRIAAAAVAFLAACIPPSQPADDYYYQQTPPPPAHNHTAPAAPAPHNPTRSAPINPKYHPAETAPKELPGGPIAPSSFKPVPTRACALCSQPADAGWVYCPVDGARIPDPNAADNAPAGMRRITYEYADGTQRFYDGDHAAKISKIEMDLLNHWVNSGQTANPYSGLQFKELTPKGAITEKSIP